MSKLTINGEVAKAPMLSWLRSAVNDIASDQLAIYLTYGGHKTTADARLAFRTSSWRRIKT
jgi:hypothetical protein